VEERISRTERRRRTQARILAAASRNFAEHGYDRTTIRAVAADAGVDPALVMQYFGSKEALFREAVHVPLDEPLPTDPEKLTELLLSLIGSKLDTLTPAQLSLLRSMFTHPEAAQRMRESLNRQLEQFAAARPGDDARLRAALILAIMLGINVTRNLLELGPLREASPAEITELLRPCLQALTSGSPGA
jgi:AcrR family transcriptional regulator